MSHILLYIFSEHVLLLLCHSLSTCGYGAGSSWMKCITKGKEISTSLILIGTHTNTCVNGSVEWLCTSIQQVSLYAHTIELHKSTLTPFESRVDKSGWVWRTLSHTRRLWSSSIASLVYYTAQPCQTNTRKSVPREAACAHSKMFATFIRRFAPSLVSPVPIEMHWSTLFSITTKHLALIP